MPWKDDTLKKLIVPSLIVKPKDLDILNPKNLLNPTLAFREMKSLLPVALTGAPLMYIPNLRKRDSGQPGDIVPIELNVATSTNPNGEIAYYIVPAEYAAKDVEDTGGDASKFEILHGSFRSFSKVVEGEHTYWVLKVMPETGYTGDMEVTIKDTLFHLQGSPYVKNREWKGTRRVEGNFPTDIRLVSGSYKDSNTVSYELKVVVPDSVTLTDTEVAASNFHTSGELKSVIVKNSAVHLVIEQPLSSNLEIVVPDGFLHSTDNRTNWGTSLLVEEPRIVQNRDNAYAGVIDTRGYRTRIKTGICCPCSPTPMVGILNKSFHQYVTKNFTNSCDLKWVFGNTKGEITVKQTGLYQINIASNGADVKQGFSLADGTNTCVIYAEADDIINYNIGETTVITHKNFRLESSKPINPADYTGGLTIKYIGDIKKAAIADLLFKDETISTNFIHSIGDEWKNLTYPSGEKAFDLVTGRVPLVVTSSREWSSSPANREQWYYTEINLPKSGEYIISCFGDDTASLLIDGSPALWGLTLNRNTQRATGGTTIAGGQFTKYLTRGRHLIFGYNKNTVDNSLQYFSLSIRDAETKEELAVDLTYKILDLPLNCPNHITTPKLWSDIGNKVFYLGGDKVISNLEINR